MKSKSEIRDRVWRELTEAGAAAFPGAFGRIPNFVGAGLAAEKIAELEAWKKARTVKSNPDLPQRPLRKRALDEGKVVYMAVPRLTSERCFVELDPDRIRDHSFASTIKGAFKLGRTVHPREMRAIDLIVCGSVAVGRDGARLGKGGGFSDLEYALTRALGLVDPETPVVTTVHALQVVDEDIPMTPHDVVLDYIATPEELICCQRAYPKPEGIFWGELGGKLEEVPILRELATKDTI